MTKERVRQNLHSLLFKYGEQKTLSVTLWVAICLEIEKLTKIVLLHSDRGSSFRRKCRLAWFCPRVRQIFSPLSL